MSFLFILQDGIKDLIPASATMGRAEEKQDHSKVRSISDVIMYERWVAPDQIQVAGLETIS